MTLIFLKTEDGKDHHAILNTDNICYMEGIDETEEYPKGSKTKIVTTGGMVGINVPYKVIADHIAKAIEQGYVLNEQLSAARNKVLMDEQRKMVMEVMEPFRHNHD